MDVNWNEIEASIYVKVEIQPRGTAWQVTCIGKWNGIEGNRVHRIVEAKDGFPEREDYMAVYEEAKQEAQDRCFKLIQSLHMAMTDPDSVKTPF